MSGSEDSTERSSELSPSRSPEARGYLSEAVSAFVGDPTWPKKALIGTAVQLIPIVGWLAVSGYSMVWMRQVAWGSEDGLPKRTAPDEVVLNGLRILGVGLWWGAAGLIGLAVLLAAAIGIGIATNEAALPVQITGGVAGAALGLLGLAVFAWTTVTASAGAIRAIIYQRVAMGTSTDGPWAMVKRNRSGFWRAFAIEFLLVNIPNGIVNIGMQLTTDAIGSDAYDRYLLLFLGGTLAVSLIMGFFTFCTQMISAYAYGRWVREIDPMTLPPVRQNVS